MKKTLTKTIAVLVIFIATGIIVYSFNNIPPHQFKEGQCGFCHLNYKPPFIFRDNITTLCNYCHSKRNILSHLVGVKPSMRIPPEFRLDTNGELTCDTCHNIHMDRFDPETRERTFLLRTNLRGREFCDSCHIETTELVSPGYVPTHAGMLDAAHFGYYTGGTSYSPVDRVSMHCMQCHEGATAGAAPVTFQTGHAIGESHPIGLDYMKEFRKKKDLREPRSMSSEVKLFGGKVGCTSCHNPFKLSKHKLSVTMEESKLCFECHLK